MNAVQELEAFLRGAGCHILPRIPLADFARYILMYYDELFSHAPKLRVPYHHDQRPPTDLRGFLHLSARRVPPCFRVSGFSSCVVETFNKAVFMHNWLEFCGYQFWLSIPYDYRLRGPPEENVPLEADTKKQQLLTTPSVPSEDPEHCLEACPSEVLLIICKFVDWSDKGNLRLSCRKLARAGLTDMLDDMEPTKKPIELYFGISQPDLTILGAVLSNEAIASKVQKVSLGCALFNEHDMKEIHHRERVEMREHQMHGVYRTEIGGDPSNLKDKDMWTDGTEFTMRQKVFLLFNDSLTLIQRLNMKRKCARDRAIKKGDNVNTDDCVPDIVVEFGCTFERQRRETLPRRLRRILRIHHHGHNLFWHDDYTSLIEMGITKTIYREQARFLDWSLFYLFGALLTRGSKDIKLDAIRIHFIFMGMLSCHKKIPSWLAEKWQTDVRDSDSDAEGPEVMLQRDPGDMLYRDAFTEMSDCDWSSRETARAEVAQRPGRSKSRILKHFLPRTSKILRHELGPLVDKVTWLDVPQVGFDDWCTRDVPPGAHSLWHSKLMRLVYSASQPHGTNRTFRCDVRSPGSYDLWRPINHLPLSFITNLEMIHFKILYPDDFEDVWRQSKGSLRSLTMRRGVLMEGRWSEILHFLGNVEPRGLRHLEVSDLFQEDIDDEKIWANEDGYTAGGSWTCSPNESHLDLSLLISTICMYKLQDTHNKMVPPRAALVAFRDPDQLMGGQNGA